MKNNIKLLLLILSSESPHFLALENQWRKYMNKHPMITARFLKCKPNTLMHEEGDTFYANCFDSWEEGVFNKVIQSLKFYNGKYDIIFRTNVSSFIRLDKLYEIASNINKSNLYSGIKGTHNNIDFVSGAGCFFSPDVVNILIERSVDYKGGHDDVMIGHLLKDVPIFQVSRYIVSDNNLSPTIDDIKDNYHIRIKLYPRALEYNVFEHLYNLFYR